MVLYSSALWQSKLKKLLAIFMATSDIYAISSIHMLYRKLVILPYISMCNNLDNKIIITQHEHKLSFLFGKASSRSA